MKTLYNVVTLAASIAILSFTVFFAYNEWHATNCSCCATCKCGKTDCKNNCCADKKCCEVCGCTDAGCCKAGCCTKKN